jgi:cyclopropane fatty-acyl-phospholipid synthase-like methyltransferase
MHMSTAEFEALYRRHGDPWGYATSPYERDKYRATLDACGLGPFANALELGASIGVLSAALAPRCQRLVTIDAAPTAVHAARERLAGSDHAEAILGTIPAAIPQDSYDLVVASEILYYLEADALEQTLAIVTGSLLASGRLVAVHWRPAGPERPFTGEEVHARLRREPGLVSLESGATSEYLLDVLERR